MNSKLKSIRAGHRSAVSRIFKKFDEIRESGTELADFDELSHILDTLKRKQELLRKLDEDIIQDLDQVDIETEIVDSDEYSFNLETKVRQIAKVIKAQTSTLNANATSFTNSRCDIPPSDLSNSSNPENQNYTHFRSDYRSYSSVNSEYNKLPKLNLPTFDGDILQWQSFWDSYEAAVHTNQTLSNVQRFNYLKSLLHDEAFQTINGFALTNSNYERAVSLLQQRFGQVHKITQKYMNALLELPSPKNTLQSLRNYYDKIETYVRGLESLGQTEDTFGSLLVPIILKKLPGDVRINLTREHGSTSWQLSELRQVIFHELNIMEEGNPAYFTENLNATAAFYTNAKETQHNAKETGTILHSQAPTNVLLKTAVAQVSSGFQWTDANILFDEGAQRSFITEKLATDLNLAINGNETISLSGFGDTNESRKVRHLNTGTIYLLTDAGKLPINVLIVPEIAAPLKIYVHKTTNLKYLSGLKLAHPFSHDPIFEVSLLIGVDHYWSIVEDKIVRGAGPTAVKSKIGYLLSGPIKGCTVNSDHTRTSMMNVLVRHKDEEINLEKFWEVEAAGIENTVNKSENGKFQDVYEEDYISYHGNRYVAKLPWKEEHPTLLDNRNIAQRRTENVIKRLSREPTLLQKYGQIINEQEKRGFIERVDEQSSNTKVHYIPHHPVRIELSTTPIRIVFDCSCKPTHESPSLNDCLMDLSPNLNDLTGILLRFRMHKYAVATDIEKAFLNIGLDEDDRDVTRFFWLSNPDDPNSRLTTYRFRSVLFGATCSPFILNAVLRKHLTENPTDWTALLKKDLYVDNIISSFNQQGDLLNYFHTSRSVFEKAGFNLRSWASNCKELQNRAAAENVIDDDKLVKILGLRWDTENDILTFAHWESKSVDDGITTKRDILRQSSNVYDPLGIISPITVRSKMLMQHIWEMKVDWDEPLSSDVVSQWRDIQTDTYECTKLEISRCYLNNTLNTDKLHIHIFTDASLKAYGSCAYIVDVDGKQSTLVMAKNKVAPLKKMTIPKLELMASVIGARLLNHLMEHINIEQATLWCDSQIVLNWLKTEKQLPAFVRNRVTEIKQLTSKFKWRYCPTESNPADLLSRGMSADKFKNSQLWMHGPQWITDTSKWPSWISNDQHQILSVSTDDTETVKKDETTKMDDTIGLHRIFNIDQFSSYQKLLRVSAYVLRFIRNCRKDKQSGMLTVSEIQNMSIMLIRNSQHRNYAEIVNDLQAKRTKNSLVKQLKLYLDDESIIRCGVGRINNANTLESAKFPVLLPPKDKLTDLIITDAHTRNFHCGLESTVTALRQYYWIPTIRRNVKSLLRLCVTCRKVTGRPYPVPDPPPLPADRLREDSPFSVTGVDFAGPLHVRTKEGQNRKVYICLFTCASTRAVHLEIVQDLSQNTFILAFCRFTSRKSLPKVMISDNASTFIAGAKVVEHLTKSSYVTEKLNSYGTTWRFIPKRAPWFGGWWERLIGLTKNCIKKVLGRALVDIETLNTIVTEVESILNDRPLTYVLSDPMDDEPLTPSHLLYGRRIRTLPYNGLKDFTLQQSAKDTTHESVTRQSKLLSQILKHFKKRWKQEYLTSLREHYRYTGRNTQNIKVGDVVQIQDDVSRVNWNLAKIDKLVYGKDGLARSAIIRTKNGVTNRPISKLYPLELNSLEVESRAAQSEAMKKIKTWTNAC